MSALQNIVVGFQTETVYGDIQTFLRRVKKENINTYATYRRYIKISLEWLCKKPWEILEISDIASIQNSRVVEFQLYLSESLDKSNGSINTIISSMKSLFYFLERQERYRNAGVSSLAVSVKILKEDSKTSGMFKVGEPEKIAIWALNHKKKGQEKSALIRLAYTTGLRKSSLLNIKWEDIEYVEEDEMYVITAIVKTGKKIEVPITHLMYSELEKIKENEYYNRYKDGKVFHLSTRTIQDMMNDIRKQMNFPESRNIVFHSFRGYPSHFGDLEELQDQLGHSKIETTKKYYRHTEDLSKMISMRLEQTVTPSSFDELSKEELIELIMSQDKNKVLQMHRKKEKLLNTREQINV